MYDPCLCGDPACPACGPWYAERDAADEEAELTYRRMLDDEEHAARRTAEAGSTRPSTGAACACCGRPCRPEDAPLCLACTLLGEDETDDSERWNYPEQHHDHD